MHCASVCFYCVCLCACASFREIITAYPCMCVCTCVCVCVCARARARVCVYVCVWCPKSSLTYWGPSPDRQIPPPPIHSHPPLIKPVMSACSRAASISFLSCSSSRASSAAAALEGTGATSGAGQLAVFVWENAYVCMCVCVCVRACIRVCACACACVRVGACVCVGGLGLCVVVYWSCVKAGFSWTGQNRHAVETMSRALPSATWGRSRIVVIINDDIQWYTMIYDVRNNYLVW